MNDGTLLIASDPWLEPYREALRGRFAHYQWLRSQVDLFGETSRGHEFFGLNRHGDTIIYREWAPNADYLALIGDFNDWDRARDPMTRDEFGVWTLEIPADELPHGSLIKTHVAAPGYARDRIPAYIRRAGQRPNSPEFTGQYWETQPFEWQNEAPKLTQALRIYEAHVGMAQEDARVGTYTEFAEHILPRIANAGYNAVQLMAVQEHPYYGSFGYHVSSFFAPSSRFGTPEELKLLIDTAHGLGLLVIMDIVHSHAVKNLDEGLNQWDGSDYQYFHAGGRGDHPAWDSKLFDYTKPEVLRFLLSNVRYWLEEFRFDGFRFDGVTSMLYHDHGLGRAFSSYEDYFGGNTDKDALAYLMLANELAHHVNPQAITIAEDMSGMPGMARPVEDGGLGFDYRLSMGVPDLWIKVLKERRDEDWPLRDLYTALLNRRREEKHIAYAESHDQAMVGDKTIAFWLMDAEMYHSMSRFSHSDKIRRGIALHKMIRLLTFALAGEAYLNFMGNEFGHPEWIDFPRPENGFSYHYARRQWSLVDAEHLRYADLAAFDQAMQHLDAEDGVLLDPLIDQLALHEDTRQLVFRRGPLVYAFNFHAEESFPGLRIPVPEPRDYRVILDTDEVRFGGEGRVEPGAHYPWQNEAMYGWSQSIQLYLPARSALVLKPV